MDFNVLQCSIFNYKDICVFKIYVFGCSKLPHDARWSGGQKCSYRLDENGYLPASILKQAADQKTGSEPAMKFTGHGKKKEIYQHSTTATNKRKEEGRKCILPTHTTMISSPQTRDRCIVSTNPQHSKAPFINSLVRESPSFVRIVIGCHDTERCPQPGAQSSSSNTFKTVIFF